jgi:hypothetical protein
VLLYETWLVFTMFMFFTIRSRFDGRDIKLRRCLLRKRALFLGIKDYRLTRCLPDRCLVCHCYRQLCHAPLQRLDKWTKQTTSSTSYTYVGFSVFNRLCLVVVVVPGFRPRECSISYWKGRVSRQRQVYGSTAKPGDGQLNRSDCPT